MLNEGVKQHYQIMFQGSETQADYIYIETDHYKCAANDDAGWILSKSEIAHVFVRADGALYVTLKTPFGDEQNGINAIILLPDDPQTDRFLTWYVNGYTNRIFDATAEPATNRFGNGHSGLKGCHHD